MSNGLFFAEKKKKKKCNFKSFTLDVLSSSNFSLHLLEIRKNYGTIYSLIITHLYAYLFDFNFYLFQNYTKKIYSNICVNSGITIARANLSDIRFKCYLWKRVYFCVYVRIFTLNMKKNFNNILLSDIVYICDTSIDK